MIEQHYSHVKARTFTKELSGVYIKPSERHVYAELSEEGKELKCEYKKLKAEYLRCDCT